MEFIDDDGLEVFWREGDGPAFYTAGDSIYARIYYRGIQRPFFSGHETPPADVGRDGLETLIQLRPYLFEVGNKQHPAMAVQFQKIINAPYGDVRLARAGGQNKGHFLFTLDQGRVKGLNGFTLMRPGLHGRISFLYFNCFHHATLALIMAGRRTTCGITLHIACPC